LFEVVKYAALNPWQFIYYVLLCLSPLFLISAVLSWKLAKHIEAEEKQRKMEERRKNAIKNRNKKKD